MALSIDWVTKVISVPKADLTLVQSVPTEIRALSIPAFHAELRDIEDSEDGMVFPDTHSYVGPIDVGGVALAAVISMINGYTVTFEDGSYAVNLTGANSNIGDNVNVNSVSVRSANSAGLTYSKEVEDQSFTDARVWVDTDTSNAGTTFPVGTPGYPVNNLADAQSIISARTLPLRIQLAGAITQTTDLTHYDFKGEGHTTSQLTLDGTYDTSNVSLENLLVTGSGNGSLYLTNLCELEDFTNFSGEAYNTELGGTITLGVAAHHEFVDCHSGVAGTATPIIDCNGLVGLSLSIRRYAGGIELRNITDAGSVISVDLTAGRVILAASCTAGTIVVRGTGYVTDNSTGMTQVFTGLTTDPAVIVTPATVAAAVWTEPVSSHTDASLMGGWLTKKVLTAAKYLGLR